MPILSLNSARSKIREILKGGHSTVFPTVHCKERMIERNVQMDDILHLLFWGTVEHGQQLDDKAQNIFRVTGGDIEDEPLIVVVQIVIEDNRLNCISVF